MSSLLAAEYRLHAVECLELAECVSDIEDKARLVEIAQKFFELANKLEQRELAQMRAMFASALFTDFS